MSPSVVAYLALIAATALERVGELVLSRRNAAWSLARGGREYGQEHYPFMVVMHTAFLLACPLEVLLLDRPFVPALGWAALAVAVFSQALRWWCITTLGPRWNTRVLIVPGLPRVTGGPYRFIAHPNYVAVVLEGLALPLVHSAWITALAFSALNAALLARRIRCENGALDAMEASPTPGRTA